MSDLGQTINYDNRESYGFAEGNYGIPDGYSDLYTFTGFTVSGYIETEKGDTAPINPNTSSFLVEGSVRYYNLRGYYTVGTVFESWVSQDPASTPPSGHSLTNITIVSSWVV